MPDSLSKRQIRNIMRAEHKSSGITKTNPGLYRTLNQYLQRLHEAYLGAHAENKTQKALTLTKEIRDTERDISTIYELRERKILLMAQDIVRGGAPSLKYLFPEEKLLLLKLSSILLEMRRDISIDFHHRVDSYIRTIAKEFELDTNQFTPSHLTEPLSEETSTGIRIGAEAGTGTSKGIKVSALSPSASPGSSPGSPPSSPAPPSAPSHPLQDMGSKKMKGNGEESRERGDVERKDIPVAGTKYLKGFSPELKPEEPALKDETTIEEAVGEEMRKGGEELEEGEEEEQESIDFLRDYAVAGTLDSIPQFRASDLHDYRFEAGEIITLPLKMAELLERQGKLFIIEMEKRNETN